MTNIFSKDEYLGASPAFVGFHILKLMKKKKATQLSIFDLADTFRDEPWFSTKALYFGMIFLYSLGAVKFNEPYVIRDVAN